jgi:CRISPR/Cas system CMR-associated protein Cmr5 small subunit
MSLERNIAGAARDLVQSQAQPNDPKHESETAYRSFCEGLPILLRAAGLAQTAAFLKGKEDKIYEHLETQLKNLGFLTGDETLIAKTTDPALTMPQYRLLFEMAMLVAFWHKRMAQALLRKKEAGSEQPTA